MIRNRKCLKGKLTQRIYFKGLYVREETCIVIKRAAPFCGAVLK